MRQTQPVPQPATATPAADTTAGAVGTSLLYGRQDHAHPFAAAGSFTQTQIGTTTLNKTTTSSVLADIDAANLDLSMTTTGGVVQVSLTLMMANTTAGRQGQFSVLVDATPHTFTFDSVSAGGRYAQTFIFAVSGLAAGAHTFNAQFAINGGDTLTVSVGATMAVTEFKR